MAGLRFGILRFLDGGYKKVFYLYYTFQCMALIGILANIVPIWPYNIVNWKLFVMGCIYASIALGAISVPLSIGSRESLEGKIFSLTFGLLITLSLLMFYRLTFDVIIGVITYPDLMTDFRLLALSFLLSLFVQLRKYRD